MTGRERRTTSMRDSPPGGAQRGVGAPLRDRARPLRLDLGDRAPLPLPEVGLAQPRIDLHVQADRGADHGGGVDGAPQVGADQPVRTERGDARGDRRGLRQARRGELGVEVALHPALDVVVGLAVAEQDQPAERHPSPPACSTCASANAMRGQSFHSRSSP